MSIYEIIVRPGEGGYPSTGWHRSQMPGPQSPPGQVQCGHSKIWVSGSYGHFLMSVLKSSIWSRGISPHPVFGLAACLCSYYIQRMTQESCQEPKLWRSPGCFFQPPLPSLAGIRRRSVQTPMPAGLVEAAAQLLCCVDTAEDGSPHPPATAQHLGGSVSLYVDIAERVPAAKHQFQL